MDYRSLWKFKIFLLKRHLPLSSIILKYIFGIYKSLQMFFFYKFLLSFYQFWSGYIHYYILSGFLVKGAFIWVLTIYYYSLTFFGAWGFCFCPCCLTLQPGRMLLGQNVLPIVLAPKFVTSFLFKSPQIWF